MFKVARILLDGKQRFSVHSVAFLSVFLIFISYSGIKRTTGRERKAYSSNEMENELSHSNSEYIVESKSHSYIAEDDNIYETVPDANDDKRRFWWTNGNRNSSKGPPKDKFPGTEDPKTFNASSTLNLISRLLRYVIINSGSTSRMQFFNANYRRNFSSGNDTAPRAIFGGPLCFGLCGVAQVYWANSSVHYLSGNRIPVPSIVAPSTAVPLPNPSQPGQG